MTNRFEHFSMNIFKIAHYWNQLAAVEMKKHGLKGVTGLYLLTLFHNPDGLTAAQLAQRCCRDKADVSRAVSAFKAKGFLEPTEGNGYRAVLRLSGKGARIAAHLDRRASIVLDLVGEEIPEEKRMIMYECMDLISGRIQELCTGEAETGREQ